MNRDWRLTSGAIPRKTVIFDGRNLYNAEKLEKSGLEYFYIGQKISEQ